MGYVYLYIYIYIYIYGTAATGNIQGPLAEFLHEQVINLGTDFGGFVNGRQAGAPYIAMACHGMAWHVMRGCAAIAQHVEANQQVGNIQHVANVQQIAKKLAN